METVIGFRDRTMLEMLWTSAPRLSELLAVNVEDLNFEEGLLTIREGKGERERVLPIGAGVLAWSREYLRALPGPSCGTTAAPKPARCFS